MAETNHDIAQSANGDTDDSKTALYWTAGIMVVILVLGVIAYALGWLSPAPA
jgi:hypothetical protein